MYYIQFTITPVFPAKNFEQLKCSKFRHTNASTISDVSDYKSGEFYHEQKQKKEGIQAFLAIRCAALRPDPFWKPCLPG